MYDFVIIAKESHLVTFTIHFEEYIQPGWRLSYFLILKALTFQMRPIKKVSKVQVLRHSENLSVQPGHMVMIVSQAK